MLKKLSYGIIILILINLVSGCSKEEPVIFNENIEIIDPVAAGGVLPVDDTWVRDESRNVIYNFTNMYGADVIYEKNLIILIKCGFSDGQVTIQIRNFLVVMQYFMLAVKI